jgi:hypothetical protein
MTTLQIQTEGVGAWRSGVHDTDDQYVKLAVKKGNNWLRIAGINGSGSDDLAILAFLLWRGMSELYREDETMDEDYLVAGNVLDEWVTDHDAELLAESIPAIASEVGEPVGGMTPEVTAVHTVLLDIVGTMRERWSEREEVTA